MGEGAKAWEWFLAKKWGGARSVRKSEEIVEDDKEAAKNSLPLDGAASKTKKTDFLTKS